MPVQARFLTLAVIVAAIVGTAGALAAAHYDSLGIAGATCGFLGATSALMVQLGGDLRLRHAVLATVLALLPAECVLVLSLRPVYIDPRMLFVFLLIPGCVISACAAVLTWGCMKFVMRAGR